MLDLFGYIHSRGGFGEAPGDGNFRCETLRGIREPRLVVHSAGVFWQRWSRLLSRPAPAGGRDGTNFGNVLHVAFQLGMYASHVQLLYLLVAHMQQTAFLVCCTPECCAQQYRNQQGESHFPYVHFSSFHAATYK